MNLLLMLLVGAVLGGAINTIIHLATRKGKAKIDPYFAMVPMAVPAIWGAIGGAVIFFVIWLVSPK